MMKNAKSRKLAEFGKGKAGGGAGASTENKTAAASGGAKMLTSDGSTSAKFNTLLKIPPAKINSGNFKSVPREYTFKMMEKEKTRIPPVAGYRPKFSYVDKKVTGKTHYGSKAEWESVGKTQNERVKKAQFEEYSKLSMDILKALDQEQVDFKNNKDMQSQLFLMEKN